MTTVGKIIDFMETIAPQSKQMSWDNVGHHCGRKEKEVRKILIALDLFEDTANEAVQIGADMIITHHPLLFFPAKSVTADTPTGRILMNLITHDISSFHAHTNLDLAPGGVNDCLANALHLENVSVIDPIETDSLRRQWGLLRMGTVEMQTLDEFLPKVKEALHCPGLRYASGGKNVHAVAVGGGACADDYESAARAGCDTFITSDVKYNRFWDAHDIGLNIIDAGHFYTENPVCEYLRDQLSAAFPEIEVVISKDYQDCMKFF